MASDDRSDPSIEDRGTALGWHVFQGEELAGAYARAADAAEEAEWADFFRYVEDALRSLSEEAHGRLPGGAMRRRRPPW